MKKSKIGKLILISIFIILISLTTYSEQDYSVKEFNINIEIDNKNRYDITEQITVDFLNGIKNIKRVIPSRQERINMNLSNLIVLNEPFSRKDFITETALNIGNLDESGVKRKKYILKYKYDFGDNGYDTFDEINYNIFSNQSGTYAEKVSFSISLPKYANLNEMQIMLQTKDGWKADRVEYEVIDNIIKGHLKSRMEDGEVLNIKIPLPQGYFNVKQQSMTIYLLNTMIYLFIPYFIALSFLVWWSAGVNEEKEIKFEFYPPEGIIPTEALYYKNRKIKLKDFMVLFLYWANKGYLDIYEKTTDNKYLVKEYLIKKNKEIITRNKHESHLFRSFFSVVNEKDEVLVTDLRGDYYKRAVRTMELLKNDLKFSEKSIYAKQCRKLKKVILLQPFILFSLVIIKFFIEFKLRINQINLIELGSYILNTYIGVIITSLIIVIIYSIMKKRNEQSEEIINKIKNFENFLINCDKDAIKMKVREDKNYFNKILPYALILDPSAKWVTKFENIDFVAPAWYHTVEDEPITLIQYVNKIKELIENFDSHLYAKPKNKILTKYIKTEELHFSELEKEIFKEMYINKIKNINNELNEAIIRNVRSFK